MPRILRNTIVACLLAAIAMLRFTSPSHGCSYSWESPTFEQSVENAEIIVVAQVIGKVGVSGAYSDLNGGASVALRVEKYLKGNGSDILFSGGAGYGTGGCRLAVYMWQSGIVYLSAPSNDIDSLAVSRPFTYAAVVPAESEAVDQIQRITGQINAPTFAPFEARIHAFGMFLTWLFFNALLPAPLLLVLLCFLVVIGKVGIFVVRLSIKRVSALASHRTGI